MLPLRRRTKTTHRSKARKRRATRRLRAEILECRRVLAGTIDVDTATTPGSVILDGDSSNNVVTVVGTGVPGQFMVTGESGTLLRLDGGLQTFPTLLINGITDDIFVDLVDGEDTFTLGSDTSDTEVGNDVDITNEDDDTNIFINVDIGNDLNITRSDIASSELEIRDSIIRDDLDVDNNDGDTKTDIQDTEIEGEVDIVNGDGDDANIFARVTIGARQFVRPDDPGIPADPVVDIENGDGGSLTSFTDKNDADSSGFLPPGTLGRPTVFGGIDITNGDTIPSGLQVPPPVAGGSTPDQLRTAVDIVVFNNTVVIGQLDIRNDDGHTETVIVDSEIGTDTKLLDPGMATSGYGDFVNLHNGDGFDVTLIDSSTLPWGLDIDNDINSPMNENTWGSQTDIRDSEIGGRDGSLGAGAALIFLGDNGDDVFNISDTTAAGTTIDGSMSLDLFLGDDDVSIIGVPGTVTTGPLTIDGDDGDDSVYLENVVIESMVMITLADGVDRLEIRDGVTLPGALVGTIELDGGRGADFYHIDSGIPFDDFEIFIP